MLQFINKETAAQFEALTESDMVITKQKQYHGKLSNIPPEVAKGMVARGTNLVKEKVPVAVAGPQPDNTKVEPVNDKKVLRKKEPTENIPSS